ncbi:hypothetical protein SLEP1_g46981 [Rubroshorea leprosula]|uniref:Uncharacterized protein n=1 Tax=Rubroshorea leprosula TaxID=152421 RepID=A0AAV5LP02_9ROSI|nr:hypothetical protein SLEP1_g46981 [Rubroshorea leprosula]
MDYVLYLVNVIPFGVVVILIFNEILKIPPSLIGAGKQNAEARKVADTF